MSSSPSGRRTLVGAPMAPASPLHADSRAEFTRFLGQNPSVCAARPASSQALPMTSRDRVVTLPPGAKTRDSHKAVLGHLKDKDETHQPLPFPGSAHGLHDQGGSRDAFDAQRASFASGTQSPWFGGAPWSAGEKRPADAYFPSLAAEFFESDGEPEATRSLAESSVRSSWQAQAAPALAGRADAMLVASTADPSAVADHSPPSAAVETAAGSGAAASKAGKQPVPGPRGYGGVASTHDAPGGAGGSRSPASTPAVAFQHVQLGTVINAGYFYLLHNLSGNSSEVGRDTCDALTQGAPRTTDAACDLLFAASLAMRLEWHDALVLPAIGHNHTASRPGSTLHRLASAVALGSPLTHTSRERARHAATRSPRTSPRRLHLRRAATGLLPCRARR